MIIEHPSGIAGDLLGVHDLATGRDTGVSGRVRSVILGRTAINRADQHGECIDEAHPTLSLGNVRRYPEATSAIGRDGVPENGYAILYAVVYRLAGTVPKPL